MLILLSMLAQTAPVDSVPPAPAIGPTIAPGRCHPGTDADGEIIVCGHVDTEPFRLRPLADRYRTNTGPGLGFRFGDVTGNAYVAQEKTIDGKPDKRIMVTLKTPF